ncbi:hypothetical protein ACFUTV_31770 [Streptomyces sp. NPDC057298]|uniref:hypothetical protein n=1 Tax=Streptomyces sp. NPDC057298 TaxID=3346091 RepID=UPI0036280BB3
MSDATAAILAAFIGASSALAVGAAAFAAALKQVSKAALTQRDQAFWEHRRNTYANYLGALSSFFHLINSDSEAPPSDSLLQEAGHALAQVKHMWDVISLEAREERGEVYDAANLLEDVCSDCFENLEEWSRAARVYGVREFSNYISRRDEDAEILASSIANIRSVFRAELHRSVGA